MAVGVVTEVGVGLGGRGVGVGVAVGGTGVTVGVAVGTGVDVGVGNIVTVGVGTGTGVLVGPNVPPEGSGGIGSVAPATGDAITTPPGIAVGAGAAVGAGTAVGGIAVGDIVATLSRFGVGTGEGSGSSLPPHADAINTPAKTTISRNRRLRRSIDVGYSGIRGGL